MIKPLLVGNWKMNGALVPNDALLSALADALSVKPMTEVVVCPPFTYLTQAYTWLKQSDVAVGAQDVSQYPDGPYTGSVSAAMLVDIGCKYVIIGHSERRQLLGETNSIVLEKTIAALNAGLNPIICVGETKEQRDAGETMKVIAEQIASLLVFESDELLKRVAIAYEPIWAIGTGLIPSLDEIESVHKMIRESFFARSPEMQIRILYGGSVNEKNADLLFSSDEIDGALVGGASLSADKFISIAQQLTYQKQDRM